MIQISYEKKLLEKYQNLCENFISKDTIRRKIKELEHFREDALSKEAINCLLAQISILNSLLL